MTRFYHCKLLEELGRWREVLSCWCPARGMPLRRLEDDAELCELIANKSLLLSNQYVASYLHSFSHDDLGNSIRENRYTPFSETVTTMRKS